MILDKDQLWQLRNEIVLGSMYYADYHNNFGIEKHSCCDFFDGYTTHLEDEMKKDIDGFDDREYFKYLDTYDNPTNLWDYYCTLEDDCLKIDKEWVASMLRDDADDILFDLSYSKGWDDKTEDEKNTAVLEVINGKIAEIEEDYPELKNENDKGLRWYDEVRDRLLTRYAD